MEAFNPKQSESILANIAHLLRRTFNSLQEAVFIIDAKTVQIIDCNSAASQMFGYSHEEMLGRTTSFLHVDEAELQKFMDRLNFAIKERGHLHLPEFHMKRKNGDIFTTDHTVAPLEDDRGERIGWVSVIRDITERKQAALEREQYHRLFNTASDLMVIADPNGTFKKVNPACIRTLGYSEHELISKPFVDFIHPDDKQATIEEMARQLQRGFSLDFENRYVCKDGSIKWLSWRAVYAKEEGTTFATARDITEQKRTEGAVRLQSEIARNISEGIYLVSAKDLSIVYANPRMEEMFGYDPGEMNGKHVSIINAPTKEDPVETANQIEAALKKIGKWSGEVLNIRKDGAPFWGHVSISMMHHPEYGKVYVSLQTDIAARKEAEEALSDSEKRYHALFDQSPDGIVLVNTEGQIIEFNEAAHRDLGYTREEFSQLSITDLDPFEGPDDVKARIRKAVQDGKTEFFVKHRTKRGELRDVHIIARIIMLSGKPVSLGIWHDITDIKNIRDSLEQKTAEQNAILENALVGIAFLKDRRFVWINTRMEQMFGYQRNELSGLTTEIFYPSRESYEQFGKDAYTLLACGETYAAERLMKRRNGSTFWCSLSGKAIDPSVLGKGSIWILQDITERKLAEKALREEEERYRSLFESAKDGIFILGSKGFIACNQKGADMYGLPKEEIIGRSPIEFSPEIQPNGLSSSRLAGEIIDSAMKGEVPRTFEWQSKRADGSLLDVEINLSRFELGGETCLQAIVRDITERKKLEKELLKTQRLESLGVLAGGIAHDFNNLLQAMMGNISLAKTLMNPGEKVFPLLEEAEKASEQAKELSYRLLTFSKGGDPVRGKISLEGVLKESISLCLSGSNVACELRLPKDLDLVEGDKGQMNQVFNNLLINAKEAMPDGGTVEINATNVKVTGRDNLPLKEGNYVKVSLADHGIGIPEKYLPRIFDPYFSTKDRGSEKGMGLGLAICYSIVARHEGYIAVESRIGVGTVFHIYLPAAERKHEEGPGRESHSIQGKGRVLFMDDDERVRKITGAMLEQIGYEVEFAKNGEEAIEVYTRAKKSGQTFDAAILDLTVQGGMGGEKAVRRLLEIDPEIRAVVSSGYADDPVMKDFEKYGFVNALAKPYNAEVLKRLLARLQP